MCINNPTYCISVTYVWNMMFFEVRAACLSMCCEKCFSGSVEGKNKGINTDFCTYPFSDVRSI